MIDQHDAAMAALLRWRPNPSDEDLSTLAVWRTEYPADWIAQAIDKSREKGGRKIGYALKILREWKKRRRPDRETRPSEPPREPQRAAQVTSLEEACRRSEERVRARDAWSSQRHCVAVYIESLDEDERAELDERAAEWVRAILPQFLWADGMPESRLQTARVIVAGQRIGAAEQRAAS